MEERNVQIGLEVGSDIIGPILGAFIAIFIDKACGIGFLRALDEGKKLLPEQIRSISKLFKKYNHGIVNLLSD